MQTEGLTSKEDLFGHAVIATRWARDVSGACMFPGRDSEARNVYGVSEPGTW